MTACPVHPSFMSDPTAARAILALAAELELTETAIKHELLAAARSGDCARVIALVGRWLRLAAITEPSRLLVVCRSRTTVRSFREALLPHLRGGFDALPVTTFQGLAFNLLSRGGDAPRPLSAAGPPPAGSARPCSPTSRAASTPFRSPRFRDSPSPSSAAAATPPDL